MSKQVTRRITNAAFGALGGLLGGFGFAVVVTHSRGLRLDGIAAVSLAAMGIGAILGAIDPPKLARRALALVTLLWPLATLAGFTTPAVAQEGGTCGLAVNADRPVVFRGTEIPARTEFGVDDTTANQPLTVNLDTLTDITFMVFAPREASGRLTVTIGDSEPVRWMGGTLYRGEVRGGFAEAHIRPTAGGFSTIEVGRDSAQISELPFGLVRLDGVVQSADGPVVCSSAVWLRIVSNPLQSPFGIGGFGLNALGSLGMAGALLRRSAPMPTAPKPPPPGAPPRPIPASPHGVQNGRVSGRVVDADGNPVSPTEPLVAGREYRLELTLNVDREQREETPVGVVTSHDVDTPAGFRFGLNIGAGPFEFGVPFVPRRMGGTTVDFDLLHAGNLVQSERFRFDVVDQPGAAGEAVRQTAQTTFQGADGGATPSRPRDATLILYRDPADQSVDLRVLDPVGNVLYTYDTPAQPATVDGAAGGARAALVGKLMGLDGFGAAIDAAPELLDEWLPELARAGRALLLEMFPTPPGEAAGDGPLAHVAAGGLVQVNQNLAGLGHATVPWNLVYDRRFLATPASRACRTFTTHPPSDCPESAGDPTVACPTGFWGFRFVVEQPPTWVHKTVPPPLLRPIGGSRPVVVNFNVDPSFGRWKQHLEALWEMGGVEILEATSAGELLMTWAGDQERIDLLYFYAHHVVDGQRPALTIGGQAIDRVFLDGAGARWDRHPLVLLNGCGTGANAVATYAPVIDEFRARGASGVVGTECTVSELLAERVARDFLARLLGGADAGRALLEARRALLQRSFNPGGLAWALYAVSDLELTPAAPAADHG